MISHEIIWSEPSPFWPEATTAPSNGAAQTEFLQPAILRFTTDAFMNEFFNVIATDPSRLGEYRARPETWRGFVTMPPPNKPAKAFALALQRLGFARKHASNGSAPALPTQPPEQNNPPLTPLKLYQPAHQRYYLVTGCLICQMPGLPDRKLDTSKQERAAFVVRRFLPPPASDPNADLPFDPTTWREHAFISSPTGSYWQPVNRGVVDGEEQLPLFASNFQQDDQRQRRLLAGLIPAGKREAYMGAGSPPVNGTSGPGATTQITARKVLFRNQVAEPWKSLVDRSLAYIKFNNAPDQTQFDQSATPPSSDEVKRTLNALRAQIQTASWLVLSDFAGYLKNYLPDVWGALQNPGSTVGGAQADLMAALRSTVISSDLQTSGMPNNLVDQAGSPSTIAISLADALGRLIANPNQVDRMEKTISPYLRGQTNPDWPDFLFPLADPADLASALPVINQPANFVTPIDDENELVPPPPPPAPPGSADAGAQAFKQTIDRFAALVIRALSADTSADQPAPHLASQKPADLREGYFVIRFIYERPSCGPLHTDVVSPPTIPFQLAGFFDPDAPARPIRIGLPLDTTPAGIRKFDRNTAFMISDVLCGQIQRFKALTFGDLIRSVLPWPLHKDLSVPDGGPCAKAPGGPSFGMICSLSIPIITLCAFILLIIMVILFDLIFSWLPFFVICFPVPGLKGKK
jgi:hypothetical protein